MPDAATSRVLLDKRTPVGHGYVELLEDGQVKAGYWSDTAKTYASAEEAYARFRQSFDQSNNHSAWNICYALEAYMQEKDDAR